jgi:hypothetical protein
MTFFQSIKKNKYCTAAHCKCTLLRWQCDKTKTILMYAQLGDIQFEKLFGPSTELRDFGKKFAVHPKINGRDRLQATGIELKNIDLVIKLNGEKRIKWGEIRQARCAHLAPSAHRIII